MVFVGVWNVAVMDFCRAELAPDHRALVRLLVQVGWLWEVHFAARIVEPLFLDVFEMISVGVLIQRIDSREDLGAEGALKSVL